MQLMRMFYHNINALDIVFPNILFPPISRSVSTKLCYPSFTRNDHGIKEPEESPKTADARPRQTDHTPGQAR